VRGAAAAWVNAPTWGQHLAALGIPGLFVIALIDAAAVPVVGGAEALTMVLAWQEPARLPLIVLAGALGATIGALVFYRLGRAGGDLALSRLQPAKQEWVKKQVTRHAFWALLVCVVLPPPFPTKPLVLAAGAVGTPLAVFTAAVFTGRLARYSVLGYLGYRFGDQAAQAVRTYYPQVLLVAAGLVLLCFLGRKLMAHRSAG
jgi:membrane protein YqaA with SNARE-associated domain